MSWEQEAGFPAGVEWQATLDYTPWLAAPTGLFTLRTLGVDRVRAHNADLVAYGQRVVGAALGPTRPSAPTRRGDAARAAAAGPRHRPGRRPGAAPADLRRAGDRGRVNAWQGRGLLRLCAQVYNRAEEYDRLAERLPALLGFR